MIETLIATAVQHHRTDSGSLGSCWRGDPFHQRLGDELGNLLLTFAEPVLAHLCGHSADLFRREFKAYQLSQRLDSLRKTSLVGSHLDDH